MIRALLSSRPRLFRVRYERPDGCYREITVPVGKGRLRLGSEAQALEIAERRLSEQYGDTLFLLEQQERVRRENPHYQDPAAELVRRSPGLHQENYTLVSVKEVRRG